MRRLFVLLACAALAVAAAGCGGGGGERLTKEEFIAKADEICGRYKEKITALNFPNVDPRSAQTSDDQVRAFAKPLNEVADIIADQRAELDDLLPPEDFQDRYNTALADLDTQVETAREAAEAADRADREGIRMAFARAEKAAVEADRIAKEYGLKVCGR